MAITSAITVLPEAADIPSGYTIPVITSEEGEESVFETDIAITEADAANAVTGITNVVAAVKAYFDATYGPNVLKLDVLKAIAASLHITKIQRLNTGASIFITGVEVFRCKVVARYN